MLALYINGPRAGRTTRLHGVSEGWEVEIEERGKRWVYRLTRNKGRWELRVV